MSRKKSHPNCYIIAGSNGAGKTTFATEFLPVYANCRNFGLPSVMPRFTQSCGGNLNHEEITPIIPDAEGHAGPDRCRGQGC
jgi:hypothetical protein